MHHQFGEDWVDAVAQSDGTERLEALLRLARRYKVLPAPVYVALTAEERATEQGKRLVELTLPLNSEGSDRLIMPARGRIRFTPASSPHLVVLTKDEPLYIGLWGKGPAHTRLSLIDGGRVLAYERLPADTGRPPKAAPEALIRARLPESWQAVLTDIELATRLASRPLVCRTPVGQLRFPICQLQGIGHSPDDGLQLIVEIDAAAARVYPDN